MLLTCIVKYLEIKNYMGSSSYGGKHGKSKASLYKMQVNIHI